MESKPTRKPITVKSITVALVLIVFASIPIMKSSLQREVFGSFWNDFTYHAFGYVFIVGFGVALLALFFQQFLARPNIGSALLFLVMTALAMFKFFWLDPFIAGLM